MRFSTISNKTSFLDARGCPRSDDSALDHAQVPSLALTTPTDPTHPSYGCVGCAAHTTAPRSGNGKRATCRTAIRDAQRRESDRPPAGAGRAVGGRWILTLSTLSIVINKEKKKQCAGTNRQGERMKESCGEGLAIHTVPESRPPDIGFLRFVSRSLMNGFRTAISASSPGSIRPSC